MLSASFFFYSDEGLTLETSAGSLFSRRLVYSSLLLIKSLPTQPMRLVSVKGTGIPRLSWQFKHDAQSLWIGVTFTVYRFGYWKSANQIKWNESDDEVRSGFAVVWVRLLVPFQRHLRVLLLNLRRKKERKKHWLTKLTKNKITRDSESALVSKLNSQ